MDDSLVSQAEFRDYLRSRVELSMVAYREYTMASALGLSPETVHDYAQKYTDAVRIVSEVRAAGRRRGGKR